MPVNEYKKRCLSCKIPKCEMKCPVSTPIRDFISHLKKDELEKAFNLVINNNPLAYFTSLVCPHTKNCKLGCVLNAKGSVEIPALENFVSSHLDLLSFKFNSKTNKKVLIVGSGPAGISLAIYLKKLGIDSLIIEKNNHIGGMLTYGIPYYRLDKTHYEYLLDLVKIYDLKYEVNHTFKLEEINNYLNTYEYIVLATGLPISKDYSKLTHVYDAVSFIDKFNRFNKFNSQEDFNINGKAYVVGCGHVALDCARILRRHFTLDVSICYRRDVYSSKLTKEEIEEAKEDGVKFIEYITPYIVRYVDDKVRLKWLRTELIDGKLVETENIYFDTCDHLFYAIGQTTDLNLEILKPIDKYKTNIDNVYLIGDLALGASSVVEAINSAKELADEIKTMLLN